MTAPPSNTRKTISQSGTEQKHAKDSFRNEKAVPLSEIGMPSEAENIDGKISEMNDDIAAASEDISRKETEDKLGETNEKFLETAKFEIPSLIKARYLLVGGGTASFSAMKTILEKDPSADIWIISDEECMCPYV